MPPEVPPAPRSHLLRRATRGTAIGVVGIGANQGLRLVGNVFLSRLLFPEAFGLMALANLLLNALQMMSNMGIAPAIIRHPRGEERAFLDTAFSIQALRGVALWAVGCVAAVPLARFYEEPELVPIVPVVTFTSVLLGVLSTKVAQRTRYIDLAGVTVVETASRVAAVAAMVAIAWVERSVWALVWGGVVGTVVQVVASHVLLPGRRDRFGWDREAARDLYSFGKWIFVSTLFTFLAMRVDVAMLGKLLPIGTLGVYSIGIMLPGIVGQLSGRLVQTVLMPALSESQRQGEATLRRHFARARSVILPLGALALVACAVVAPAFFQTLYDERYHDAGWIAQLSLLPAWFTFLQESAGRVLLARGDSRAWASSNVLKTAATAMACWLGFQAGGLPGLILGSAVGALCGHGSVALRLAATGVPTAGSDAFWTLAGLALAGLGLGGARVGLAALGVAPTPLAETALGLALLALPAGWILRRSFRSLAGR